FLMVYIREAHPEDGWKMPANERQGIKINDPKTAQERTQVATSACSALHIKLPCVVDQMDDKVNKAYSAWPDRLYIVGVDGKIALAGGQGPSGFAPSVFSARVWLQNLPASTPSSAKADAPAN